MDAAFSVEQVEIRRTLREMLLKESGPGEARAAVLTPAGYDERLWLRLADQLGLPGLAVERRYGGVGCGLMELALACEEAGRALLPSPLTATAAVTIPLVAALGTPKQRAKLLPRLASGRLTGTFAVPDGTLADAFALTATVGPDGAHWAGGGRAGGVQAHRTSDGWRLYGEAGQVLDGHSAGLLLVAAHTGGYPRSRTVVFALQPEALRRVSCTRLTALDETRPQARVELRNAEAEPLGSPDDDVRAALAGLGGQVAAVLAAEAVGAAGRVLEQTVEYARVREQFDRPIGSFQAVKHRLADLYVAVQTARSAAYYAAWSAQAAVGGLALAQALETARVVAGEAIQLHGGIGVTWEHDVQRYFKRAASDELLFGPVHRLRERAAGLAGLFDTAGAREAVVL